MIWRLRSGHPASYTSDMILKKPDSVENKPVAMAGAQNVCMQLLCGPDDGCPNFAMRKFTVAPGGCTPRHQHDYEHEVYILAGEGVVFGNGKEQRIKAGDSMYVPANEVHQFRNDAAAGAGSLEFLCLVPALVHKPGAPQPIMVDCAVEAVPAR